MMRLAVWLLAAFLLGGCGATSPSRELEPTAKTNEVASTNVNLGIEYLRRGDYDRALEKLKTALAADPTYPLTYNTYGVLYQKLGDNNKAEWNFRKALDLAPHDSPTLNNYGRFLCDTGHTDKAKAMFEEAAANPLYDTPEIPITNAGTCALKNGDVKNAERYFRAALQRNPEVATALLQMAQLSFDQGKYLPARGYLQRYAVVATHTAESLWLGIEIEQKLGDKDAVSSYALLLRNTFPDSEQAKKLAESGLK